MRFKFRIKQYSLFKLGKNNILHIIDQRKFEKGYINSFQICSQLFKKKVIKRSNANRVEKK